MSRRLKWLQSFVNKFFLKPLELFFKLFDLQVLGRHAAEERIFIGDSHHLNILEIARLGFNFDHLVEGWHDLDRDRMPTMLFEEAVKIESQAVASAVLRRNTLYLHSVVLQLLGVARLHLPRVVHRVGLTGQLASTLHRGNGGEGDHGYHEHVKPATVVRQFAV